MLKPISESEFHAQEQLHQRLTELVNRIELVCPQVSAEEIKLLRWGLGLEEKSQAEKWRELQECLFI